MADNLTPFEIGLKGRLIKSEDPSVIGENFQSLKNMRYTANHPEGIGGMTPINSTALVNPRIKNGFHFSKANPQESHILVHAYDSSTQNPKIYENTATIPSSGSFTNTALFTLTDTTTLRHGLFSKSPNGTVAFCDGRDSLVWGGNEFQVGGFINYTGDNTQWKDYTLVVRNNLYDSANVATLSQTTGGLDENTKLLLHFDNNVTDSSSNPKTTTNVGLTFSAADYVFPTHSAVASTAAGAQYMTVNDSTALSTTAGIFTFDARISPNALSKKRCLFQKRSAGSTSRMRFWISTAGALRFNLKTCNTTFVDVTSPINTITTGGWQMVSVSQNASNFYLFKDGVQVGTTQSATYLGRNTTGKFTICAGSSGGTTSLYSGKVDEVRFSLATRYISDYDPPVTEYGGNPETYTYLGATRPLKGFKFYIDDVATKNTASATMSVYYWSGTGWVSVTSLVDNTTNASTTSLNQTGTVTFASTVSTAKVRVINGVALYWYKIVVNNADNGCQISKVTVDTPMQQAKDIWDGSLRNVVSSLYYSGGTYLDITSKVFLKDFSSTSNYNKGEWVNLGGITTAKYMLVGFLDQTMGLSVIIPEDLGNTNNAVLYVSYSADGKTWTQVSGLIDGTSKSGKSFAQSGYITWAPISSNSEFPQAISNDLQLFYYKLNFSATLSGPVLVDYVSGIPSPKTIRGYKIPVLAKDRLWLLNNEDEKQNQAICSSVGTPDVWNGDDTTTVEFGDETALVGGTSLYSALAGNIYEVVLFFKKNALFGITGNTPQDFQKYEITITDGLVAPKTLRQAVTLVNGVPTPIVIWQGANGLYLFDNKTPIPIHGDIANYFDKRESDNTKKLHASYVDRSVGEIDSENNEYHWLFANANSTGQLNAEEVYDLKTGKWYTVSRGSSGALQCIFGVNSVVGNRYAYGARYGIMERLENGTAFDSNEIAHEIWTGDIPPLKGSIIPISSVRKLKLISVCTTGVSDSIVVKTYVDGGTTASTSFTFSAYKIGQRLLTGTNGKHSLEGNKKGIFHSVRLNLNTTGETYGFSPIYLGGHVKMEREDL